MEKMPKIRETALCPEDREGVFQNPGVLQLRFRGFLVEDSYFLAKVLELWKMERNLSSPLALSHLSFYDEMNITSRYIITSSNTYEKVLCGCGHRHGHCLGCFCRYPDRHRRAHV